MSLHRLLSGMWFVDESRFKSLNPTASQKIDEAVSRFWRNGSLGQHFGLIAWAMFRLKNLHWVFCKVEGGIYKRLDEHRELTEFLEDRCPEILAQHPCIRNWLDSHDVFLCQLEKTLPVGALADQPARLKPGGHASQHMEFPRLPRSRGYLPQNWLPPYIHSERDGAIDVDTQFTPEHAETAARLWKNTPRRDRRWLTRWTLYRLDYVCWVFFCLEGGVYKRLDEHREMTEFLEQRHAALLVQYPWLRNWLNSQDVFLSILEKVLPVGLGEMPVRFKPGGYTYRCVEYPRSRQYRGCSVISEGGIPG